MRYKDIANEAFRFTHNKKSFLIAAYILHITIILYFVFIRISTISRIIRNHSFAPWQTIFVACRFAARTRASSQKSKYAANLLPLYQTFNWTLHRPRKCERKFRKNLHTLIPRIVRCKTAAVKHHVYTRHYRGVEMKTSRRAICIYIYIYTLSFQMHSLQTHRILIC